MGMPIYWPRELRRCSVAQSTMRTYPIVIVSPSFCHGPCFIERQGPMLDQEMGRTSVNRACESLRVSGRFQSTTLKQAKNPGDDSENAAHASDVDFGDEGCNTTGNVVILLR